MCLFVCVFARNHDINPTEDDWLPRVMQWAEVSQLVHRGVTDEEMEAAMNMPKVAC